MHRYKNKFSIGSIYSTCGLKSVIMRLGNKYSQLKGKRNNTLSNSLYYNDINFSNIFTVLEKTWNCFLWNCNCDNFCIFLIK